MKLARMKISKIRRDGETQIRQSLDGRLIKEYSELMAAGVEFPPVTVWFDGRRHWLSDGFQRIEAAERIGVVEILAEVRRGTQTDAQWHSYGANSVHGLRRTRKEVALAVQRAIKHAKATKLSNVQLAKHLGIPESTLRRIRGRLSSPNGEDSNGVRIASRAGKLYQINTMSIGKNRTKSQERSRSVAQLHLGIDEMKARGSADAKRVLTIFRNWAFGATNSDDCIRALEQFIETVRHNSSSLSVAQ